MFGRHVIPPDWPRITPPGTIWACNDLRGQAAQNSATVAAPRAAWTLQASAATAWMHGCTRRRPSSARYDPEFAEHHSICDRPAISSDVQ